MHEELPEELRRWVIERAEAMGLPSPDSYLRLLVRLEKQRREWGAILRAPRGWR